MPDSDRTKERYDLALNVVAQAAQHDRGLFRSVLSGLPMPFLLVDPQERVVGANQACLDMLGIEGPVERCYGNTLAKVFYNDPDHKTFMGQSFKSGTALRDVEVPVIDRRGRALHVLANVLPLYDLDSVCIGGMCIYVDHTARKRAEQALEKRMVALTLPLDQSGDIAFDDLFNRDDIQQLQDEFATATGVASLITRPDGTPITRPSNFCRLCSDIIRNTPAGCANCYTSDALVGKYSSSGPTIQRCMSGGLWDAGAGIAVGGKHVANWLVGQVRDASLTEERMRAYAREIGADEDAVALALGEVPVMEHDHFRKIAQALFTLANQLSAIAYQNIQQSRSIAAHQRTLEALRKSEGRFSLAMEAARDGLWDWDVLADSVYYSPGYAAMLGYSSAEVPQEVGFWADRIHPEDKDAAFQANMDCIDNRIDAFEVEFRMQASTGEWRWILGRGKAIARDAAGRATRLVGTHTDITERRRMQELMVQTEKMLSVGGLAAGIAHEINNPLSGILQNVQVLQRRLTDETAVNTAAAAEAGCSFRDVARFMENRGILSGLESVRQSSLRAAQVVRSMLEFSRGSESRKAPSNMNALLDKTIELCATDFALKKEYDFRTIRLEREYDEGLPDVPCAGTQIQQVMMNVLGNAAHALRGQAAPKITLRTAREDHAVRIEIEDNGLGMDEATRRKIFEPFFTTKPVGEGTGLGLSVSYFIVTNNHKGAIEVESAPDMGARFIIALPLA